jgi:plasmid stability protein
MFDGVKQARLRELAMASVKFAKKNDSIEIRLPDETKSAFREKCRREGRTVSDAVRSIIEEQVEPRASVRRRRRSLWRIGVAMAAGAVLGGGIAAPSIAASADDSRPAFQALDRDRDGALTYEEFSAR